MTATGTARTESPLLARLPETRDGSFWDGTHRSYIPGRELGIDPSLTLHRTSATDIDPVTAELIRYSLLNINLEHTALLSKLAVSQLVIMNRDYQSAILTEDAEILLVGPCVQFFARCASLGAQYTLEHRSKNPGIRQGDMFLNNDPYVGASHQMDTSLLAPVFIGDELFCWVTNTLHHQDLGGNAIGSFCHDAIDAWDEPMRWPPIKIVEGGELREDIERLWTRQSRFPVVVGMDLRAAIASNEFARGKIVELVERYGADVVKGVMRGTQDANERLFVERLRSIPDGRWSQRFYSEGASPGDPNIYTLQVNITKSDDRLIVDNLGTDAQVGSISMTYAGFTGAVLAAVMSNLAPDLAGAFGGPYRRVEFRPEPGLIICADSPAAVTCAVFSITMLVNGSANAVAKMLSCGDGATREQVLGGTYSQPGGTCVITGFTEGQFWQAGTGNVSVGSFGATPIRDGVDFGGQWWMPGGMGVNVEDDEEGTPALMLYRRCVSPGLDGAGRNRGGLGVVSAVLLREDGMIQYATGESIPSGAGMMGSQPGSRAHVRVVAGSDAGEQLAASQIPLDSADVNGQHSELPWKTTRHALHAGDVVEGLYPNMPGYGDPLRRKPAAVLDDVVVGLLDPAIARRVYGVIVSDGTVDEGATAAERLRVRTERLSGRVPEALVAPPAGAKPVGELLHVVDGRWWCNGADLGSSEGNYKDSAIKLEVAMRAVGPEYESPFEDIADQVVFREFICPVTGYRIDTEIALRHQPPLHDFMVVN